MSRYLGSEIRPTRLRVVLKSVKHSRRAIGDCFYDFARYFRHSSTFHYKTRDHLASRITATCHSVERGLALPQPRPGFGANNISYLLDLIDEYVKSYGIDNSLQPSTGALDAYLKFNEREGLFDYPNRPKIERLVRVLEPILAEAAGGTIRLTRESIGNATKNVGADFFSSRHSIRQFSDEQVSSEDINAAVEIAQKAPAVCNRQEGRVYVIHDKQLILQMLMLQGSRGFNDQVGTLLVVTNRLTAYSGSGERNQCWVDGGLFAMSLVLGLHARGLGTCCLNWCKTAPEDGKMRRLLNIPTQEVIIMLVAVGHIPANFEVARSMRRPLEFACRDLLNGSKF